MTDVQTPAHILRLAWNDFRLDAIRGVVTQTIGRLEQLAPRDVLGRELSSLENEAAPSPVREALLACCQELREEGGLTEPPAGSGRTSFTTQPAAEWVESYGNAVERYRKAAGIDLTASLARL